MLETTTCAQTRDEPEALGLGRLYRENASRIRQLLVRLGGPHADAEDLTHEVFVIAWEHIHQLREPAAVHAWLNAIAVKVAAGARRRARLRRFLGLEVAGEVSDRRTPASEFESREASRIVYQVLEGLTEKKRTTFILFELQGLSGEEIALATGCPLKTVWTRLFHARREFADGIARLQANEERARATWR